MSIPCPVCQNIMHQTGNPKMHCCPKRKINFPLLNIDLEMSHATVYLSDSGEQIYLKIISAEYCFEIYAQRIDESSYLPEIDPIPRTIIKKLQRNDKSSWDHSVDTQFEFMEFLTIDAVVNLPWNNHSKIRDIIKTYLVFS